MRHADAPPPGWYPDPTGGPRLWWWDGGDWTDHQRVHVVAPSHRTDRPGPPSPGPGPTGDGGGTSDAGDVLTQAQLRALQRQTRTEGREAVDVVAEARRAARAEVEKAMRDAGSELDRARARWMPRVEAYMLRLRRWRRTAVVLVIAFVVLQTWAQATFSRGLFEWVGDRMDAVTGAVVLPAGALELPPTAHPGTTGAG